MLGVLAAALVAIGGTPQPTSVADAKLTPGAIRTDLTVAQICATKWGEDHRAVTATMKLSVYKRYGFSGSHDVRCTPDRTGKTCEVDHRVPRCVGGADVMENLSPQPYGGPWNAHMKDHVEDRACKEICDPSNPLPIDQARSIFLGDWTQAYVQWFGEP